MHFAFSQDQLLFRDAVVDLLKNECPPDVVRRAWTNKTGRSDGLWQKLAEQGVIGLTTPENYGGLGLSELDLVLLLEAAGRAALPEPLVDTVAVAAPTLAQSSNEALKKEWLPKIAAGAAVVAYAPAMDRYVTGAQQAELFLFEKKGVLYAMPHERVKLSRPQISVDRSRRLYKVRWQPENAIPLDAGAAEAAFDRAVLGTSAQLLGLAAAMLDMTVEYVKTRQQFGVAIGSFQAIKHHLANALIALEFAKPMVYRAAYALAHGVEARSTHVSMAKHYAGEAATAIAKIALQCHGAIGYTTEYDLHMWMKRAWALEKAYGDAAWHRERVAKAIL